MNCCGTIQSFIPEAKDVAMKSWSHCSHKVTILSSNQALKSVEFVQLVIPFPNAIRLDRSGLKHRDLIPDLGEH